MRREADNGSLVGASPCLVTVLTAQQAAAATAAAAAAAAAAEAAAVEARLAEAAAASAAAPAPAAAAALPAPAAHVTVGYSDLGDVSALEARLRARLLHRCGGGGGAATLAGASLAVALQCTHSPPSLCCAALQTATTASRSEPSRRPLPCSHRAPLRTPSRARACAAAAPWPPCTVDDLATDPLPRALPAVHHGWLPQPLESCAALHLKGLRQEQSLRGTIFRALFRRLQIATPALSTRGHP